MPHTPSKRERLEEAAIALFATKGLARTTVKDIATVAGVTEGALYRHYSSKEELAWRLFNRELENFIRLISDPLFDERLPFALRLRLAIKTMYEYSFLHHERFAFILLTQHGFPEERLLSKETDPMKMLSRFVGQAVGRGDIPPCDSDLYAALLMGALLQPLILHRYQKLELNSETCSQVAETCLRMLGSPI